MIGPKEYAKVLKDALSGKTAEEQKLVIEGFLVALSARGQKSILPRIVSELERRQRERKEKIIITFANDADQETLSEKITEDLKRMEREEDTNRVFNIDESLVGGYRIETEDHLIDRTQKRALYELYQRLIS